MQSNHSGILSLSPMQEGIIPDTERQYSDVMNRCRKLFEQKTKDYGTAWRVLRLPSLTDQLYIKAARIRNIQQAGKQLVADDVESEFVGLYNYSAMALIQLELGEEGPLELDTNQCLSLYDAVTDETRRLFLKKNHDYDGIWRSMRVSSITDLILMKILRIKQIEDNEGETLVSEGIDANYRDIMNYAVFALILLSESKQP